MNHVTPPNPSVEDQTKNDNHSYFVGEEVHIVLGQDPSDFITTGVLPEGLVYDEASQSIKGTAQAAGEYNVFANIISNGQMKTLNIPVVFKEIAVNEVKDLLKQLEEARVSKDLYENAEELDTPISMAKAFLDQETKSPAQVKNVSLAMQAALDSLRKVNMKPVFHDAFGDKSIPIPQGQLLTRELLTSGLTVTDEDGDLTGSIELMEADRLLDKKFFDLDDLSVLYRVSDSQGETSYHKRTYTIVEDKSKQFTVVAKPRLYVGELFEMHKYLSGQGVLGIEVKPNGTDHPYDPIFRHFVEAGEHEIVLTNGYCTKTLRVTVIDAPEVYFNGQKASELEVNKEDNLPVVEVVLPADQAISVPAIIAAASPTVLTHTGIDLPYIFNPIKEDLSFIAISPTEGANAVYVRVRTEDEVAAEDEAHVEPVVAEDETPVVDLEPSDVATPATEEAPAPTTDLEDLFKDVPMDATPVDIVAAEELASTTPLIEEEADVEDQKPANGPSYGLVIDFKKSNDLTTTITTEVVYDINKPVGEHEQVNTLVNLREILPATITHEGEVLGLDMIVNDMGFILEVVELMEGEEIHLEARYFAHTPKLSADLQDTEEAGAAATDADEDVALVEEETPSIQEETVPTKEPSAPVVEEDDVPEELKFLKGSSKNYLDEDDLPEKEKPKRGFGLFGRKGGRSK